MHIDWSTLIAWLGFGFNAGSAFLHLFLHRPMNDPRNRARPLVEYHLGYATLFIGALIAAVAFLAEALKLRPEWMRYVGEGASLTLFVAVFTLIAGGGALYVLINTSFTAFVAAMFVFVSLTTNHDFHAGGLFIVGGAVALVVAAFLWLLDDAQSKIGYFWKLLATGMVLVFVVLVGLDGIDKTLLSTHLSEWLFLAFSLTKLAYIMFYYWYNVEWHIVKHLMYGDAE